MMGTEELPHVEEHAWVPVLNESDLIEDITHLASARGISIVLIRKGDRIYALRNRCAHMSCTLASGVLDGYTLQCPCHEWKFDITNGEFVDARELKVQTYACKSEGGTIQIRLEER